MCNDCGCGIAHHHHASEQGRRIVDVLEPLMAENDRLAAHNRVHFDDHGVLAINIMSSPGAGKTALIEATIDQLLPRGIRIAVIEGDLETENDAERIRAHGVPAIQICTSTTCHLDAHMVHEALHELDLDDVDLLFIENVGNLVCPAGFDLGQHASVTLLSVTEGDDKPAKYPVMFRGSDLTVLTKADLLDVIDDFDPERAEEYLRGVGYAGRVIQTATRRSPALEPWIRWLETRLAARPARPATGAAHHHRHAATVE